MMGHVYTMMNHGHVSPSYMRSQPEIVVCVTHPRKIAIEKEGMDLVLLDGEPDLPVGKDVKVWLQRWFHCETLESLHKKEANAKQKAAEQEARSRQLLVDAKNQYLEPVNALLAKKLSKNEAAELFIHLRLAHKQNHAVYKRYWGACDPSLKQQSNDSLSVCDVIGDSIQKLSQAVFAQLMKQGTAGQVAYAYSPNEGANSGIYSPGKKHFRIDCHLQKGRLVRNAGDTLCKPARTFWGLNVRDGDDYVTCQSCQDRMVEILQDNQVSTR